MPPVLPEVIHLEAIISFDDDVEYSFNIETSWDVGHYLPLTKVNEVWSVYE